MEVVGLGLDLLKLEALGFFCGRVLQLFVTINQKKVHKTSAM